MYNTVVRAFGNVAREARALIATRTALPLS
jgi:hypothetical protein